MSKEVSLDTLMGALPEVLNEDPNIRALANAIAIELMRLWADNDRSGIYYRIDSLEEPLLDILASDFKVDWYFYDGTLETKRAQIKGLFSAYRYLGTKQAAVDALAGLCDDITLKEWFEYDGLPGHFRVEYESDVDIDPNVIVDRLRRVRRLSAELEHVIIKHHIKVEKTWGVFPVWVGETRSEMDLVIDMPRILMYDGRMLTDQEGNVLTLGEEEQSD